MRYLTLALYAEGETDHEFFQPLLFRLVTQLCLDRGIESIEIQESFIRLPDNKRDHSNRADRIVHGVNQAIDAISFLFVHADGNGDPEAARHNRINPAKVRINAAHANLGVVGIVPVRETEAWALSDNEAIAQSLGVSELREHPDNIETQNDPKAILRALADQYHERDIRGVLHILGQRTRLAELRRLRYYRKFEEELKKELLRLGLID